MALGGLMYFGLVRIPTRHLFTVTSWMILLLAAGMASHAAGFLVQAGLVPALVEPLWDSSGLLRENSLAGQVLGALIGYDDQPSAMQVIFFAVTLAVIGTLMQVVDRPRAAAPASGRIPTAIQQS
jgi:high-affinity iron transporter